MYYLRISNHSNGPSYNCTLSARTLEEMCEFFYNFVKLYGGGFYIDYYTDMNAALNQDKDPWKEFYALYGKYYKIMEMKYTIKKEFR